MSKIYSKIIRPILFKLPTETAHEYGMEALKIGLSSKFARRIISERLSGESCKELSRFGLTFNSPLGIAAGFDKNGVAVNQLAALGFGFVEVGTVTYDPQSGNEKPRLFRLPEDQALINRLGFNNEGTEKVVERLKKIKPNCVLGVNIGKNKNVPNEEAVENYLKSFDLASPVADYIAVNVSSPNTPNLRQLQKSENLEELLSALQNRNRELSSKPLLVKIAPDLSESEIEAVSDIAVRLNLAGIIATNTTIDRTKLKTADVKRFGDGGLSGKPVRKRSTEVVSKIFSYSNGKIPIIGVGGVFTAADAYEKIAAGACLVQAYTGFIYQGFTFARDINRGLFEILKNKGCKSLDDAIGRNIV